MKRDMSRIQKILDNITEARAGVREEIAAGANLQHVHDHLLAAEESIASRARELKDWNKSQPEEKETKQSHPSADKSHKKH